MIGIIIIIAIISLVFFRLKQGKIKNETSPFWQWLSGGLAIVLIAIVLWHSIADLISLTSEDSSYSSTISLPTMPAENNEKQLPDERFLLHYALISENHKVLAFEEKIFRAQDGQIKNTLVWNNSTINTSVKINVDQQNSYQLDGRYLFSYKSLGSSGSAFQGLNHVGDLYFNKNAVAQLIHRGSYPSNHFSLLKRSTGKLYFVAYLSALHPDDPLKQVSPTELSKRFSLQPQEKYSSSRRHKPSRFAYLIEAFESSFIWLLIIAVLIRMTFRRSRLPIILTLVLIVAFGFRQMEFSIHKEALKDESRQRAAANSLRKSPFFKKSAQQLLMELPENEQTKDSFIKKHFEQRNEALKTGYMRHIFNFVSGRYLMAYFNSAGDKEKRSHIELYPIIQFILANDLRLESEVIDIDHSNKHWPKVLVRESIFHDDTKRCETLCRYTMFGSVNYLSQKVHCLSAQAESDTLEEALEKTFYPSHLNLIEIHDLLQLPRGKSTKRSKQSLGKNLLSSLIELQGKPDSNEKYQLYFHSKNSQEFLKYLQIGQGWSATKENISDLVQEFSENSVQGTFGLTTSAFSAKFSFKASKKDSLWKISQLYLLPRNKQDKALPILK